MSKDHWLVTHLDLGIFRDLPIRLGILIEQIDYKMVVAKEVDYKNKLIVDRKYI